MSDRGRKAWAWRILILNIWIEPQNYEMQICLERLCRVQYEHWIRKMGGRRDEKLNQRTHFFFNSPTVKVWICYNLKAFQRGPIIYMQEQDFLLGSDWTNPSLMKRNISKCEFKTCTHFTFSLHIHIADEMKPREKTSS